MSKDKNIWSHKGHNLLYKGENVGMIGVTNDDVEVDMISYEHTYNVEDIKALGDYMWFLRVIARTNK